MTRTLALAALVLAACGDNEPSTYADPASIEVVSMPVTGGNALDILLLIDDSDSGEQWQYPLGEQFDALLEPIEAVAGPLDLHIGVASSDYGTTALVDPTHPGPPIGQLHNGGCAGAGLDGALLVNDAPVTGHYLIDGATQNFPGDRYEVLRKMLPIGAAGCGFEQPLSASVRAFTNSSNAGFRRPSANLLILHAGDEDDCSISDTAVLGPDSAALGPRQSFRCTTFGVSCDEDLSTPGEKHGCHPRADSPYISDVRPFADAYLGLVADPARFTFASIAGPATPFATELRTPPGGGTAILSLAHSCLWTGVGGLIAVANPAVRIAALVDHFGAHGSFSSLCDRDFRQHLSEIGRVAKQMFGVACLDTTKLRDSDTLAGVQPTCGAVTVLDGIEAPLAACPAGGACFELVVDSVACAETSDHLRLVVHDAPPGAYVRARCEAP